MKDDPNLYLDSKARGRREIPFTDEERAKAQAWLDQGFKPQRVELSMRRGDEAACYVSGPVWSAMHDIFRAKR